VVGADVVVGTAVEGGGKNGVWTGLASTRFRPRRRTVLVGGGAGACVVVGRTVVVVDEVVVSRRRRSVVDVVVEGASVVLVVAVGSVVVVVWSSGSALDATAVVLSTRPMAVSDSSSQATSRWRGRVGPDMTKAPRRELSSPSCRFPVRGKGRRGCHARRPGTIGT
jgi:hypothetical protein